MQVISSPLRFNLNSPGSFARVEHNSDAYKAQQIEAFVRTHRGERPIFPDFGIDDPAFGSFDETTFGSDFSAFYEDIDLTSITVTEAEGSLKRILVEFE